MISLLFTYFLKQVQDDALGSFWMKGYRANIVKMLLLFRTNLRIVLQEPTSDKLRVSILKCQ